MSKLDDLAPSPDDVPATDRDAASGDQPVIVDDPDTGVLDGGPAAPVDPDDLDDLDGGLDPDDDLDDDLDGFDDSADWEDDGAAPAVPVRRKSRRQKRKEWRQSEKARRYASRRSVRFPIFTRSVVLWLLLFAMMGAAFGGSGAFFWAHFNTQINELREQTKDFDKRSADAQGQIDTMRNQAITDINQQIKPIAPYIAESKTIQLATLFSPYVWLVRTLDENGNPSVGTAFPVTTDDKATLMVTSLNTVKAASITPAPDIILTKNTVNGDDSIKATVVNYDANRDLALLSVPRGGMPVMDWAPDEQQAQALGLRVFPVSGFGGAGASLTSGVISNQSAEGLLHDARIGTATQGGPIVTSDAKVLAVASIAYRPLGFDPGELHFAVSINQVCADLMVCGGGSRAARESKKPPPPPKAP